MNNYVHMFHKGKYIPIIYKEAIKYYKMAIDKGNSAAMNNYAYMLKHGEEVPINY